MKKIILIHPPWSYIYGKFQDAARAGNLYPPLGLCYIASYINEFRPEYSVEIIDGEVEDLSLNELVSEIVKKKPILIGLSSTSPLFKQTKALANLIKTNLNTKIVLGGSHATVLKGSILQEEQDFDYVIYGEGEESIIEMLDYLDDKKDIKDIKGLVYRDKEKKIKDNGERRLSQDIDKYLPPARELLRYERYLWSVPRKGTVPFTTIMTTRGCPFQCIFCSAQNVFGRTLRKRSIESVVTEMEWVVEHLHIKHFSFIDDCFTLLKDRVIAMCQEIIGRGLNITFEGFTKADTVDDDILYMLKKAGMVRISFGIESGNPEMLKRIKKGITLDEIRNAFKLSKKYQLETKGSAIIGFPYETKETLMDTINFITSIKECDQVYLNICTPYPGTELYDMAVNGEGGIKLLSNDFSKYLRYGNPVIEVDGLSKDELIKYQKYGFRKFYFKPERIWYNLKRAGFKAGLKNAFAFLKGVSR